jgi:hypothetical protein
MTIAPVEELEPDVEDVLQAEEPAGLTAIPVCVLDVKTPVRVQQLPHKGGATKTRTVGAVVGVQVLRADHFRGRATLMYIGQNMLVTFTKSIDPVQDVQSWALWPANVPLAITAAVDVFVASATGTTSISVITEDWAAAK